jgi:hypothetical protein
MQALHELKPISQPDAGPNRIPPDAGYDISDGYITLGLLMKQIRRLSQSHADENSSQQADAGEL